MLKVLALSLLVLALLLSVSGCVTGFFGGCGGASDIVCSVDSDCPTGSSCLYDMGAACHATGMCMVDQQGQQASATSSCGAPEQVVACGCDGKDVQWESGCTGLPEGYSPKPIVHMGACLAQ